MRPEDFTKKYPLVAVTWEDSTTYERWSGLDYVLEDKNLFCFSVGYLVKDARKQITLVPHWTVLGGKGVDVSGSMTIPRSAVHSIQHLKISEEPYASPQSP